MKRIDIDIVQAKPDIQVEMSTDKPTIQVGIEQPAQIVNGDYNKLSNKPSINNVVLQGNKTGDELGLVNKDVFEAETNKLQENIDKETSRAQSAEQTLAQLIEEEHTERTEEDAKLNAQITAETNRATTKENSLQQSINSEIARAKEKENSLEASINNEIDRATAKENSLEESINNEITRATAKENALETSINAETTRATNKESELQTNIDNEAQARQSVDELLDKSIKTVAQGLLDETAERKQQDEAIQADLTVHINNTSNPHKVTKQQVGLGSVDNTSDADKPVSTAQAAAIQHVQDDVDNVQKLIPTQASAENQLADKDFVNSSIQNMAAFYITKDANGNPFNTHAELIAGPYYFQGKLQAPSINDYAIVLQDETKTPDALGQYPTTRYMYDGTQWAFQYIVNNTPLTAAQVAAINSGATKELIDSIPNKYVKPAGGIPESDLSSDVQTSLGLAKTAVQSFEANATIDDTTGTPTVDVEKSGGPTSPTYTFIFKHLKGMPGKDGTNGKDGGQGPQGPQGVGVKSITSGTPTVVNDKTNTPITITLTDNTTVDLVVSAENGKDGASATVDVVQTTGQSESSVMSQKAVTDELNKKANSADLANYVTTENTTQNIGGKKTVVTPSDTDDSTQIANTAWVRSHNQAIRGFDGVNYYTVNDVKTYYPADNYFLVAYTDHCVNWQSVCAEMDVVDLDTRRAVYKLKVSGLLESATSNNITTYTNKGNIGVTDSFGERLNTGTTDINNEFFLVCRTTNKGRVRYEIWYNQRYAYNRHKFYFSVDEAHARTGVTQHFTWNKMRVDNAVDVNYAKAGVTAYMESGNINPTYIPTSSWGVDVFKTALSDDESYTNVTIFNNNLYSTTQVGVSTILNTTPYIDAKIKGYSGYKTIPTAAKTAEYRILSEDKGYLGGIRYDRGTDGYSTTRLSTCSTLSGANNAVALYASKGTADTKNTDANIWSFAPLTNNNINLGTDSKRWNNGYITNIKGCKVINGGDDNLTINGTTTVDTPPNKDNSNRIATTAWAGRRYKSIADFGFTSQTTVKSIVQKIIDNWYEYCTFACTNDNFNNFSDTPDGYGTLIIEVGSNALRPLISFTKQVGDSNSYKHWQANIVRGENNQVSEIQWYEIINSNLPQTISGAKTFTKKISISTNNTPDCSLVDTGLLNGTNPTATRGAQVVSRDQKGLAITAWRGWVSKEGYTSSQLYARSFNTAYSNFVGFYAKPNAPTYDETSAETKNKTGENSPNIWFFGPNKNDRFDFGGENSRWLNGYITNLQRCKVINGGGGNSMIQQNSNTSGADITVGSDECPLKIQGKNTRPVYRQGKNGTYKNLALQSDIPIPFDSNDLSTGTYRSTKLPSGHSLIYIEDRERRFSGYFYQGSEQLGFQELYFITNFYTGSTGQTTLIIYKLRINGTQVEKTYKYLFVSSSGVVGVGTEYAENGTFYYKVLK